MKNRSKAMKLSVVTGVGALALSGLAFGSSALAANPVTPTPTNSAQPTISPLPGSSIDAELNDQSDVQSILGDVSVDAVLGNQGMDESGTVDVQENDNEVDSINAGNQQEQASFDEDINAAVQAGAVDDAAQLSDAAVIVGSVTAPEAHAMAADDTEAHAIIVGATK
jgi:hypothetical protein